MDKIVVYTKNNCFPCKMTKRYLVENGFEFIEKNIEEDLRALDFLMKQGVKQAPAIFVNDHLYLIGFNPSMLRLLGCEN